MASMVIECMWCKIKMGVKESDGPHDKTSSCCDDCLHEHYPQYADRVIAARVQ